MKPQDVISCDNIAVSPFPHLTTHFRTSHININILTFLKFLKDVYPYLHGIFFDVTWRPDM